MNGASKQRARQERIESLGIPKPRLIQWWQRSDKSEWATRIGIAVLAALALLVLCQTWIPPFAYRAGAIPARDLVTRVTFDVVNEPETEAVRIQKRREAMTMYRNRPQILNQLRSALKNQLFLALSAESYADLQDDEKDAFAQFYKFDPAEEKPDPPADRFETFKKVLKDDPELTKVDKAVDVAMQSIRDFGLLRGLQHTDKQGNQEFIQVFLAGNTEDAQFVKTDQVQVAQVGPKLRKALRDQFRTLFEGDDGQVVAKMIGAWIEERLPEYETLQYDDELSEKVRAKAELAVEPVMTKYRTGTSRLADAGKPLSTTELALLRTEWQELVSKMNWGDRIARVAAYAGMIAALYLLCGSYIFFVDDRRLVMDPWKLAKMLTLMVAAISLGYFAARDQWRGELIPLVLASIVAAVVYGRELALLLMSAACLSLTLFLGGELSEFVMMVAACITCTLLLDRIRSRTHLLYVGGLSAAVTMATVIGVGIVSGQTLSSGAPGSELEPIYRGPQFDTVVGALMMEALWSGACILVSALAMTGLLPLVEKAFGVQTDLSLLELGDASHPLLRRLAQRAPGTYNHSINVASIAEAAAEAIGANGLLVRVGAYFHDIGKMFKPEYFIENQSAGVNQHDSLQPAMSTLVIIAHVKDGADLARSHHLPEPIIDFILQHHGTTLVEYFYREAAKRSEEDPNGESVSDKDFRYPGPKPQTLEAAVMMLADTVESASRTLVDPTPARIKGLVDTIAQKKMADGQFDECGLTFRQLDRVRNSLVKSLTAIYHARVKYPGQQAG
tara:strand:+ start:539211 stop:541574 length:2364 start_codon:yes stop_codon:yes gene_type:complete